MVSAAHAKGAAEIAARGISVTKEIVYASVLGLAGGSVFKARALAPAVCAADRRCGAATPASRPPPGRTPHAARPLRPAQRKPALELRLGFLTLTRLALAASLAQVWHWNSRRKVEQFYADLNKAQAAK
jgi:hypothetical protein